MEKVVRKDCEEVTQKMNTSYSEREMKLLRDYLDEKFSHINNKLDIQTAQVRLTNGRVTKLEKWQIKIATAISVIGIVTSFIAYALAPHIIERFFG